MANKHLIIHSNQELKHKVMGLLLCTAQEYSAILDKNVKPLGLSMTQVMILHALSKSPTGTLTVNQIKATMLDESPNISRSLNKLMEHGHIVKERSVEDQRVVYITITDAGRQAHDDADANNDGVDLPLSDERMQLLYELLIEIDDNQKK